MKGKELLPFLGYSVDHPDFIAFLEAHDLDIQQLPDPRQPQKKVSKYLNPRFKQGIEFTFDRDHPEEAAALKKADPEGRSIFAPEDYRIKNDVGNGLLYLTRIAFFKPELPDTAVVQLPFGLQFLDTYHTIAKRLGEKNLHGPENSRYYEEDESDFYYERYHIYVYFERGDPEEKLQQLAVMLK
ncbi:hypothetical protein [Chitinophaga sp. RAB17]|uniref:hypothetical protein n=1 Tax=Chitinophaga sp. RAB17 TaxID=3233049 RepID=UPI003F93C596